ncbi:MAG: PIG-L deacetylase family protein [Candidatus Thorarchaeota archaeon]
MSKKLFLEPHFGDIAWSCGGLVAQNKEASIIITIFPPRRKFYWLKFLGIIYRKKKNEEKRFEKLFNLNIIYLKFKSAFMRGRTLEGLFDKKLNAIEEEQVLELRKIINELLLEENISEIYCPKAQRNQIDHLIVKKAVLGLTPTNATIYYYEDFPNFLPESKKIHSSKTQTKVRIDISKVVEEKIQAVLIYESLISSYFTSKEVLVDLIRKTPYEYYWQDDD